MRRPKGGSDAQDRPSAYERALGLQSRREHSRRELATKLAQRGYGSDEAGAALDALADRAWQSDERYAESLIRRRVAAGYGPRQIAAELAAKGIAPASHRAALAAIDWLAIARGLFERRCSDPTDRSARERVGAFLQRRGFPSDVVAKAIAPARD